MMIIATTDGNDRSLDPDQLVFKKRALRDAVICIGWLKLTSVICYIALYVLVQLSSKGHMSMVLQIMLLVSIPAQVLHGLILLLGALEERIIVLELGLWLCLILASYNSVLGLMGCVYFIRKGHLTVHFFLAIAFVCESLGLITVLCYDILIIFAYKQILQLRPEPWYIRSLSESPRVNTVTNV